MLDVLEEIHSGAHDFPTKEDLSGAAAALLRLQDTYALSPQTMANGEIEGATDPPTMTGQAMNLLNCNLKLYMSSYGPGCKEEDTSRSKVIFQLKKLRSAETEMYPKTYI